MTTTLTSTARPDSNPGAAFALRWSEANGFAVPINGGFLQSGGLWRNVSGANVILIDNTTTYVEIAQNGMIQWHTGGFTTANTPLYAISVAAGIITNINDRRIGQQTINGNTAPTLTAAITLTDAQVKALPTTAVEVISAPGAGKTIVPVMMLFGASFGGGAYIVGSPASITVSWGGSGSGSANCGGVADSDGSILTFAGSQTFFAPFGVFKDGAGQIFPPGDETIKYQNKSLTVIGSNGAAGALGGPNFTGGGAANTLTVAILYTIQDV